MMAVRWMLIGVTLQREDTTRAFYMMMADLKQMADAAEPTQFHHLMKAFEASNKLFRAYTQVRTTALCS